MNSSKLPPWEKLRLPRIAQQNTGKIIKAFFSVKSETILDMAKRKLPNASTSSR